MSFNGYLLKIGGNSEIFNKYILYESYKVSKKVLDLDSYRDGTGLLHRNVLDHVSYTVEFTIKPTNNIEFEEIMSIIRSSFTSSNERKLSATFFVPEINNYVNNVICYVPDPEIVITSIENNMIYYAETTFKLIAY